MSKTTIYLFNIPVNDFDMQHTCEEILHLVERGRKDSIARYVSILHSDYITNIHGFNWNNVRDPELLHCLNEASLSVIGDPLLLRMANLLEAPLKECIKKDDLIFAVSKELAERNMSVYCFGGNEDVTRTVSLKLKERYPNLNIVGIDSSQVVTNGIGLEDSHEKDLLIVEQINQSKPDVLFINLGDVKQEIWWQRIRKILKVPVSIGIGDAFDSIADNQQEMSSKTQNMGIKGIYQSCLKAAKTGKQWLTRVIKEIWIGFPLIIYNKINEIVYKIFFKNKKGANPIMKPHLFISPNKTIAVVQLPQLLNKAACQALSSYLDDAFFQDHVILDMGYLRHIDLDGVSFLVALWKRAQREEKALAAFALSGDLKVLLKLHRVWNTIRNYLFESTKEIVAAWTLRNKNASFFDSIEQDSKNVTFSFFGKLDNTINFDNYMEHITPVINLRNCIVNLSYVTYIDNNGFNFLLNLKRNVEQQQKHLSLCCLSKELIHLFRLNNVYHLFHIHH